MQRATAVVSLAIWGCAASEPPDDGPTDRPSDSAADTEAPLDGVRWTLGEPVVCAHPDRRTTAPMSLHDPGGDWDDQPVDPTSNTLFVGGGVTVADADGDGLLDLWLGHRQTTFGLWLQRDGLRFVDASDRLPAMPERTAGVSVVDLDADGDLDAFVSVFRAPDVVLRNDGSGHFEDATATFGLAGPAERRSMMASWADVDGDGDLDAFVGAYGALSQPGVGLPDGDPSSLFIRERGDVFTDTLADTLGPHPGLTAHTFGGAWTDVDDDGVPELYMVNDFGWVWPSLLAHVEARRLVWRGEVGLESARENMGLGVGDVNGDGVPDFLVAAWDALKLYVSDGDGAWFDESQARGLRPDRDRGQHVGWGAELVDVDNDGDLDAFVGFGHLAVQSGHDNPQDQPDGLWLAQPDGSFVDVAPAWGVDAAGRSRGFVWVDLDGNGFLDLVRRDMRAPTSIWLAACDDAAWLQVDVRQGGANPRGIGTRVRVKVGEQVWTRTIRAGGTGYTSQGPATVHLGLGDVDVVDQIDIVWPDGTVDTHADVATRRTVRVQRP